MDEFIKIAPNGQWTLEKSKKNEDQMRMIQEFIAHKKMREAKAAEPQTHPLDTLKPIPHLTGEGEAGTKEQVEAKRKNLRMAEAAAEAAKQRHRMAVAGKREQVTPTVSTKPVTPQLTPQQAATLNPLGDQGTQADIEATRRAQERKDAWKATTALLAQQGNRGMGAINRELQNRDDFVAQQRAQDEGIKPVVTPKPKQALQPPQEVYEDEKTGSRGTRDRQGTFHNQGATTSGKLIDSPYWYKEKDKVTGEEKLRRGVRTQQQKHHWSWDHNEKKWNHLRTTLGNPELGKT